MMLLWGFFTVFAKKNFFRKTIWKNAIVFDHISFRDITKKDNIGFIQSFSAPMYRVVFIKISFRFFFVKIYLGSYLI